jgi:hypothetical protein
VDLGKDVANEALRLDEVEPGWARRVDGPRLDMGSCADCVLGQVFGWYSSGFLRLAGRGDGRIAAWAYHPGHPLHDATSRARLGPLWLAEVAARTGEVA